MPTSDTEDASAMRAELQLLIEWPSALSVIASNLADHLLGRLIPRQGTSSAPDHSFWHGIDLRTPFPLRGMADSVVAHAALLGLLYVVSIWQQSTAHLADPLSRQALDAYTLSQYLPELHGAPSRARPQGKHDPGPAQQEILSLPMNPDNLRQTIVAPPPIKLERDVALPNIVAYQPLLPVQPIAASERNSASLRLPEFMPVVIGPAADAAAVRSRSKVPVFAALVVEPAPDVTQTTARLRLPVMQPKAVEPAPDLGTVSRGRSTNPALLAPQAGAPIPEAPQVGEAQRASGQFIALNLHPSEVRAPLEIPDGNRRGAFAASPSGHADASGTPGGESTTGGGIHASMAVNAPEGISVSAASVPSAAVTSPNAPTPRPRAADPNVRAKLMAAMRPPAISMPAPQPLAHESTGVRSALENRIFGGRRSYTLAVNMPNLNTATGSWIIHFAERLPGQASSPIAAPEVVSKADPAYPGELIQDGVQGTVILTATIRADGSVGDIAVVKSLDPKLDRNAAEALSRWLFRPALKDGQAIDLEAVITVPFRPKASSF